MSVPPWPFAAVPKLVASSCRGEWQNATRQKVSAFAARCLEEARATTDPRLKAFLAEMVREWQRLVEEAKDERGKLDFRGPEEDPGD
jgi:hypothetical protein